MQQGRLFSVKRVADKLDRSENAVRMMIRKGKINPVRSTDRRVMIPESELNRIMAGAKASLVLVSANRGQ